MNQLRQLGVAANAHVSTCDRPFRPGSTSGFSTAAVTFRGIPLFVYLLPYLEENGLFARLAIRRPDAQCKPRQ